MGLCASNDAKEPSSTDNPVGPKTAAGGAGAASGGAPDMGDLGAFGTHYQLDGGSPLGEGQFSVVRRAKHKATGRSFAVKCIRKVSLTEEDLAALVDEVQVMRKLDHPNLVKLVDFFSESEYFYLVMELMTGGELFNRIVAKTCYTEREARDLVKTLAAAIAYCHEQGVVHRDLKPENILLADDTDDAVVKIADFGFAKQSDEGTDFALETACGTPGYVAPEILMGKPYGKEVDVWSLGVIFYILLCGYPPFHDDNQTKLFRKIKAVDYEFDPVDWDHISDEAKDLIQKILVKDPAQRMTARAILSHPWVTAGALPEVNMQHTLEQMKKFNARRKLKGAMRAVRTTVRMQMLIGGVTKAAKESAAADAAEESKEEARPAEAPAV